MTKAVNKDLETYAGLSVLPHPPYPREMGTQRRGGSNVTTEIGAVWSQVKEGPRPRKQILAQSPGKEGGPAALGFQTSGLQKAERVSISAVLSNEACGTLLQQPQETNIVGYLL